MSDDNGPLPLEMTASAEFSDFNTPTNMLDSFLNSPGEPASGGSTGSGAHSRGSVCVPPRLSLEKTVSSEFGEFSDIPGLLRFLSDAL